MSINLNDESYNVKDSGPIFNGGVAGIAENVTMSIIKRKADDKDGAPEYKLVFTDDAGASRSAPPNRLPVHSGIPSRRP